MSTTAGISQRYDYAGTDQGRIALADGVPGQGRRLFEFVAEMDLEGIVAKRLVDPYGAYSQKEGRSELFERKGSR